VELTTRDCKSAKCTAPVADVLIVARQGSHKVLAIDPEPTTWENGGRVRLLAHQPGTARHPLASKLAHAGLAAGVRRLFRPHSETCKGGTGRSTTRSREANS